VQGEILVVDGQPAAGCLFDFDLAARRLDEAARDGEAEAHSLVLARIAEPLERHEQAVAIWFRDARATVDDSHVDDAVDRAGRDARRRSGRRVADRVRKHVRQCALDWSRLMSSRLPTSAFNRSVSSSIVVRNSCCALGVHSTSR
jgi:hypothetical protein